MTSEAGYGRFMYFKLCVCVSWRVFSLIYAVLISILHVRNFVWCQGTVARWVYYPPMNMHICCAPAGTEYLEPTDFGTVWNLVSGSVRERRETREAIEQQRKDDEVKVKLDALKVKQKRPSLVMEAVKVCTRCHSVRNQQIAIGLQWPHLVCDWLSYRLVSVSIYWEVGPCTCARTRITPVCTVLCMLFILVTGGGRGEELDDVRASGQRHVESLQARAVFAIRRGETFRANRPIERFVTTSLRLDWVVSNDVAEVGQSR